MAKIDDVLDQISTGFKDPQVSFNTVMVEDQYMEQVKVRRKVTGAAAHKLVVLSVGEMGQQGATFYGHKFSDCLKKALEWRELPTKSKRGPRQRAGGGQPQAQG